MKSIKELNIKKILITFLWICLGLGSLTLLVSGIHKKDNSVCKGYEIEIIGINNNFFIGKSEILEILEKVAGKNIKGQSINKLNLLEMENQIKKDVWISKATLYFDKNDILMVKVEEKNPIARVFSNQGTSFYIDHSLNMLPLSKAHSARLPVFTNFPSALSVLSKSDSAFLNSIKDMSLYIQNDAFLMAMIDQVDITASKKFELIPKLGDQVILFGDATNIDKKFNKLKLFYKNVISVKGWKKYSKVNLEFENQIVASILGVEEQIADSLKTMKMIKAFAEYSAKMSSDTSFAMLQDNAKNTVNESMILNSIARDDEPEESNAMVIETSIPAAKTIVNSNASTPEKVEAAKTKVVIKDSKKAEKQKSDKKEQKKTEKKPAGKSKENSTTKPKVAKPQLKPTPNNDY
jgi:cell division protein FtsQ